MAGHGLHQLLAVAALFVGDRRMRSVGARIEEIERRAHVEFRAGIAIAFAAGATLLAAPEQVYYFSAALTVFLIGMGLINPLGTAVTLQPFGQNAGAASALLGFLQMGCAAISIAITSALPLSPYLAFSAVIATSLLMALVTFGAAVKR